MSSSVAHWSDRASVVLSVAGCLQGPERKITFAFRSQGLQCQQYKLKKPLFSAPTVFAQSLDHLIKNAQEQASIDPEGTKEIVE